MFLINENIEIHMNEQPTPETDDEPHNWIITEMNVSLAYELDSIQLEHKNEIALPQIPDMHEIVTSEWPADQAEKLIKQCKQ